MFTRKVPAILAVPAMAVLVAVVAGTPLIRILDHVLAAGSTRLADACMMVIAGSLLGRVVIQTGIAEAIIKRAAEFGGDRPMAVAMALMAAVALLFTTLFGLGAIIMVGSLALPIMMSIGIPRKLAGILFILAYALGFIFNIGMWGFYQKALNLDPQAIKGFAGALAAVDLLAVAVFLAVSSRRMAQYGAWAVSLQESEEAAARRREVPLLALLIPILPLVLHIFLRWQVVPAFLAGALTGVLLTRPREIARQLSSAAVKGLEDVAPAVILMIGIGMLLNVTTLPDVESSLRPLVQSIPFKVRPAFVLFFGLLSPLCLYRGPLNPYGIGIGVYTLIGSLGLLPPMALLAAVMSVVQVQNVCDPTNTHNVWVANYTGIRVEEITGATLIYQVVVCFASLILASFLYL
jgi:H+/gluconate symporter-like permease